MLRFDGAVVVESQGHIGGLALFWRNDNEVKLRSYNKNHIEFLVEIEWWQQYRMTGMYGESDRTNQNETWDLIRRLRSIDTRPWSIIIGDLNNTLYPEDNGRPYAQCLMQGFQKVIEDCDLNDVKLDGYNYTWER